jgi:hypothetical protein
MYSKCPDGSVDDLFVRRQENLMEPKKVRKFFTVRW